MLDLEINAMFQHSPQQALVFGNRNGQGVIQLRHVIDGGNFEMRVFNEGPILAVQRVTPTVYAIALPQQIVRFNYSNNSVTTLTTVSATTLAFAPANGSLYAGVGQQVVLIDPVTGNSATIHEMPEEIGWILPLMNR